MGTAEVTAWNTDRQKHKIRWATWNTDKQAHKIRWANILDECTTSGQGPHQFLMKEAFEDFFANADTEYEMAECALYCFIRDRYGWAIPSGEALDTIADRHKSDRIIEIGCGSGYVAACLKARGLTITATNAPDGDDILWGKWWKTRFIDAEQVIASTITYNAGIYIMIMPDRTGAGEDMMLEVLTGMPTDTTLYLYAPPSSSGSDCGNDYLNHNFRETGTLPMLNTFPFEENEGELKAYLKFRNKTPQAEKIRPGTNFLSERKNRKNTER